VVSGEPYCTLCMSDSCFQMVSLNPKHLELMLLVGLATFSVARTKLETGAGPNDGTRRDATLAIVTIGIPTATETHGNGVGTRLLRAPTVVGGTTRRACASRMLVGTLHLATDSLAALAGAVRASVVGTLRRLVVAVVARLRTESRAPTGWISANGRKRRFGSTVTGTRVQRRAHSLETRSTTRLRSMRI
jgi:hypothetical protein